MNRCVTAKAAEGGKKPHPFSPISTTEENFCFFFFDCKAENERSFTFLNEKFSIFKNGKGKLTLLGRNRPILVLSSGVGQDHA